MTTAPGPGSGLGALLRRRWRWTVAGGALLLVVALLAWPLFTYAGIPADPFSSAPDACELLSDQTVREIVRDEPSAQAGDSDDRPGGSALGLAHKTRQRVCHYRGGPGEPTVDVSVHWYTSTQFNLGPTGAERAERHFHATFEVGDLTWDDCSYQLRDSWGNVCGARYGPSGANVFIQRENLFIRVSLNALREGAGELPDGWLEQRIAEVAEDVLAALDAAA